MAVAIRIASVSEKRGTSDWLSLAFFGFAATLVADPAPFSLDLSLEDRGTIETLVSDAAEGFDLWDRRSVGRFARCVLVCALPIRPGHVLAAGSAVGHNPGMARPCRSDEYFEAAQRAANRPGRWIAVRTFSGVMNANVTKTVMQKGYLRARPLPHQGACDVDGREYIALPPGLECEVREAVDGWQLRIRMPR